MTPVTKQIKCEPSHIQINTDLQQIRHNTVAKKLLFSSVFFIQNLLAQMNEQQALHINYHLVEHIDSFAAMNSKYKLVKTITDLSTVKFYYCVSYFQS